MASFDIVCQTDMQEVDNAVQGVMREVQNRYDFKGSQSTVTREDGVITILADVSQQHKALVDMLKTYFVRRKLDAKALDFGDAEAASGNAIRQKVTVAEGISQEIAKQITKHIKASKTKVQASIRGNELRVDGKKRDDLQGAIALVKEMNIEIPLQFINFRD